MNMVEFEYQPVKKIIIHQITRLTVNQIKTNCSVGVDVGGYTNPLWWTDGIIYSFEGIPQTDDLISEMIKGTIHWSLLIYGHLDTFSEYLEGDRKITIPLVNNDDPIYKDLAKWLKESYEPSISVS